MKGVAVNSLQSPSHYPSGWSARFLLWLGQKYYLLLKEVRAVKHLIASATR